MNRTATIVGLPRQQMQVSERLLRWLVWFELGRITEEELSRLLARHVEDHQAPEAAS